MSDLPLSYIPVSDEDDESDDDQDDPETHIVFISSDNGQQRR
jgi:hypothetical protein